VNGEAALQILFLRSGPEEPRVLCHRLSRNYYEARGGPTAQVNEYVSVAPLLKTKQYTFVTILHAYKVGEEPKIEAELAGKSSDEVDVKIRVEIELELQLDLRNLSYSLSEGDKR